jgi:alkylation response protein AidB-like acyl-CoA dehydrogenase
MTADGCSPTPDSGSCVGAPTAECTGGHVGASDGQGYSVRMFDEVVEAARAAGGFGDECRSLAPDVVDAAKRSGLFCMALPRQLGGHEVDPAVIADTLERLSHADGAAGWCGLIGQATAFFGWLEPAVAKEFLDGAPHLCAATVFAPTGRPVLGGDGTYTIEGRWTFASGCLHSELVQLGVLVMDGDRPALRSDGSPDWRFAYVRTSDVEIVDTWDTLGLRGTGSNDIVVRELRVPVEHMGMPMLDAPKTDDRYYQLGFWGHTAVVLGPFPLGVARRAFDELEALLPTKVARGGHTPLVEDAQVHYEIGRCRGALGAGRSFLDEAIGQAWDRICAGVPASEADQDRLRLAMQHAMTVALETIDVAYRFAGSSVLGRQSALQRCFRDLHTARTHFAFGLEVYRKEGRSALGINSPS